MTLGAKRCSKILSVGSTRERRRPSELKCRWQPVPDGYLTPLGELPMRIYLSAACAFGLLLATPAVAQVPPYPSGFHTQELTANGTTIHVRVGGHGPAVVLLHGYGETGDMWAPLAADLMRDHTVIAPDLRGMGLSSKPA